MRTSAAARAVLSGLAATLLLSACGASRPVPRAPATASHPPAAEPAVAPAAPARPAGRRVAVGNGPEGVVADARTGLVVVAVRNPPALVLVRAAEGRVLRRIPTAAAPRHLQLAAPGGPVLVPAEPINRLLELSLPGGRLTSVTVGAHPHDAAALDGRIFVGNEFGRSVSVIAAGTIAGLAGGFVQPGGIAAVAPDVAVVDVGADTVTLLDARTLRVRARLPAGAGPTHAVAGAGGALYVIDTRGGAVLSYATRPRLRLRSRLALSGAPYGVAIDRQRRRLWVTLTARDQLVELSLAGALPRVLRTYPTGRQPNTVAADPRSGRVFVADAGDGTLELIDPRP